jgi:hypothetical protein
MAKRAAETSVMMTTSNPNIFPAIYLPLRF